MNDTKLKQLFNRAVTDLSFRSKLLDNVCEVLLEYGVAKETVNFIEAQDPQTIQALAKVLENVDSQTT